MSILHEIGYYEEGELTPSPSDDDDPTDHQKQHTFPIGSGKLISRTRFVCREDGELTPSPSDDDGPEVHTEHRKKNGHRTSRRRFVRRTEYTSTLKETELRLRILALTAIRNRNLLK
jgi:hypothetical protein